MRDRIKELESDGTLTRYSPRSRHSAKRRLFLAPEARKKFDDPQSAVNFFGQGYIAGAFTKWVLGERVYSYSKKGGFIKRLDEPPPEVWEIRITEPIVQCRAFGRFAEPDTLIITDMHTRTHLGKRGSANWTAAIAACVKSWEEHFSFPPFAGIVVGDYITENCDAFEI